MKPPRSRLPWQDLLSESLAGILQRPARAALTSVGTLLGVGAFVAILGLTATASSQIDERFSLLSATEVTVEDVAGEQDEFSVLAFPSDADTRVEQLNGVEHAGVYWSVQLDEDHAVRASPITAAGSNGNTQVVAASSGVLEAAEPTLVEGRLFDRWHDRTDQQVAVVGAGVASRLGITTLETHPAVFIGDEAFTVVGIVSDVKRKADLLLSVVVPRSTAEQLWGAPKSDAKMLISTAPGAAVQVAAEAPVALDPAHPDYFKAIPPPDPRTLRSAVSGDLDELFLLLAVICLFIGTIGIANTTLVAVLERTGEIGLRRALGARSRHITAQFLTESAVLGTLGGLIGTSLGTLTVVIVAVARDWTPVISFATVAAAPGIGLFTGLLAGLYPAWRASRIQPVEALRH
ncbi:ABC transporter permease [Streptomyces liangshanensis]|uniref:ABC transporter permease n=1 Tax=Streptomyces liangshanensis TaxID=2717324 RepID=A0A6G9GWP4_9ACTN|nr:ABC transporter permease [Streptomyces liangshanensis]QIQ02630.1 ABC transporter permease [Streptomyces liangshanensis]